MRKLIVGPSSCEEEVKGEAPMLSPADSSAVESAPSAARVETTVQAKLLPSSPVLSSSMRPWKSLMLSRLTVVSPGAMAPGSTGSAAWAAPAVATSAVMAPTPTSSDAPLFFTDMGSSQNTTV